MCGMVTFMGVSTDVLLFDQWMFISIVITNVSLLIINLMHDVSDCAT
jgi:hypothetical protein